MADDLAAQIVASARTADAIIESQRQFLVLEVHSQHHGPTIDNRFVMLRLPNRGSTAIEVEDTQAKLQALLNDGWRIEQSTPTTSLCTTKNKSIEEVQKVDSTVFVLSKPIRLYR